MMMLHTHFDRDSPTLYFLRISILSRYYIRIANQLLVEDDDDSEGKGFVMLTADINVKLKKSLKERGKKEAECTIYEFCVICTNATQRWSSSIGTTVAITSTAALYCTVLYCIVLI